MIERLYLRLYDRARRHPLVPPLLVALALAASLPLVAGVRVDMSFRPLFADQAAEIAANREFEAVFGQPSGAYIGVIIERPDVLSASFVRELSLLSQDVEALPHVAEVVSLVRLARPAWSGARAEGIRVFPAGALESGAAEAVEQRLQLLSRDPTVRRALVSEDGGKTLLLARVGLPLEDLQGRREVIRDFRAAVTQRLGGKATLHFVGVSVVEEAYARIVLHSLARSFVLTTATLLLVLWLLFRRAAAVAVVMAGTSLAMPVSIGLLTLMGQDLTMINSMVPVMILIIGVADAIHMVQAFGQRVRCGEPKDRAIRSMFGEMALPCLLTTLTTALGFAALQTAHIAAIRDFGLNVALAVGVVYLMNLVAVPWLLHRFPVERVLVPASAARGNGGWGARLLELGARRPGWIALTALLMIAAAAEAAPRLRIDQRFNEEVAEAHPVRVDQALLEREFSGFLGPEVSLRRRDGAPMLDRTSLRRLQAFQQAVRDVPGVLRVESVIDHLPPEVTSYDLSRGIAQLRTDSVLGWRVREVVGPEGRQTAVIVRTVDLGTRRARELGAELNRLAQVHFGPEYEARVVGQWWLAQRGMDNILRDMLTSFATSCLLILPLLGLALQRTRLILIGTLANLIPMLFAVAFMAWAGITLRIGTAMILAIALGIAIDDSIHLLVRLRAEEANGAGPDAAVRAALRGTGNAVVLTTVTLVLGFLSMLSNDLLAIRDMGLVAAATLLVALLTDLYLVPALYLLTSRRAALPVGLTAAAATAEAK